MFEASILVVAHPDDDILWMGSVIDKMESIIFCFSEDPGNPRLGEARDKTIDQYPIPGISSLGLTEPQAWNKANWNEPEATAYGVSLEKCRDSERSYRDTFQDLLETLRDRVANVKNVFTHNPWGEYGHEEHVLVYRVVKSLQAEFHFNVWFSNYCSNRSVNFLNHYISGFETDYVCLPVNLALVNEIADIYKRNGCWTWYDDYQWFEQECLMRERSGEKSTAQLSYGHSFPLNYLKIDFGKQKPEHQPDPFVELVTRVKRKIKRLGGKVSNASFF